MPIFEIFVAAAPEVFGAAEAATAAEAAAAGAEAFGAAEAATAATTAAELASLGYSAAEIAAMTGAAVPEVATTAGMAADVVAGGAGAGAEGINAAQVAAQQAASVAPGAGAPAIAPSVDQSLMSQIQQANAEILQPRGLPSDYTQLAQTSVTDGLGTSMVDVPQGIKGVPDVVEPSRNWLEYGSQSPTNQGIKISAAGEGLTTPSGFTPAQMGQEAPNAIEQGFNNAMKWAKQNPFTAATIAYGGANMLGLTRPRTFKGVPTQPYTGPLSQYHLSPDFQPGRATPRVYQPTYQTFAAGGDVKSFAPGGSTSSDTLTYTPSFLDYYRSQVDRSTPLPATASIPAVGIYRDEDEDTRSQDAWTAAETRLGKIAKRANVGAPVKSRSDVRLGAINIGPTVKAAGGGIMNLAAGGGLNQPTGPVERMSQNIIGAGGMYPQSQMNKTYFATPTQMPASAEVIGADYDTRTNPYTGVMMAAGGITSAAGGKLLRGGGDGMSDSIPATISGVQPARLADGEFVVPADVVSHLGNGSTEAGAKQLHGMMDRVRKARTGNPKQGKQINPKKFMPK